MIFVNGKMTETTKLKYYPQHMHIHSIYEPGASMEGHIYFANLQGMRHIWFTEHDDAWAKKAYSLGFEPDEMGPDENGTPTALFLPTARSGGKVNVDTENAYEGSASLRLTAEENSGENWHGAAAVSAGKGICQSLCRMPLLSFAHRGVTHSPGDVRYVFDLCLSERPPDQRFAHIIFVCGSTEGLDAPHTLVVPISVGEDWQKSDIDISEIASSEAAIINSVGGLDNVLSSFTVRVETRRGASASLYIDSLNMVGRTTAEETKKNQTELAIKLGEKYGVTPFVTAEISGTGAHKNCYSTDTPVFPYGDPSKVLTHEQACEVMTEKGYVFSLNHPFIRLARANPATTDYDAECDLIVESYAEKNAFGASLLEVGFPFGRYAPYTTHTRLWDSLALRGVILTGYGASDSHMMTEGWFSGNNMAGFVGVDSNCEPTEADFVASMKAGRLYAANPLVMKGNFSFSADGIREMGSISVVPKGTTSRVSLSLEISNHNWKVAWVVNGKRVRLDPTTRTGYFGEYDLVTGGEIDFVRAEVYDYFGTLLLMTNPIYFVSDTEKIKNDVKGRTVYK